MQVDFKSQRGPLLTVLILITIVLAVVFTMIVNVLAATGLFYDTSWSAQSLERWPSHQSNFTFDKNLCEFNSNLVGVVAPLNGAIINELS